MFNKSGKKEAEKQLQLILKYQRVFESEDGKAVLEDLCKRAYVFDTHFDPNQNVLAFREGQRAIVLDIFKVLGINYNKFKESLEKEFSEE